MRETPALFDAIFKRLMSLSDMAIVQFINGVFGADHSPDSKVEHLATEYISKDLKKKFLDILIAINSENLYHIEAQIDDDADMAIRLFEYGYAVALHSKSVEDGITRIKFPNARVIYWETSAKTPDVALLRLEFPDGSTHDYSAPSFKFLEHSIEELDQMVILLPFYILKLRKRVKAAKSSEERQELAEEMKLLTCRTGRSR